MDDEEFTFSWLALKLLGRGLYSNPWSALSELVANGLDAQADTVYVAIDARTKSSATIEVIDNGTGMSRDGVRTYARVGYNKRQDASAASKPTSYMGRKGIGKLAALFLSPHYYLSTKFAGSETRWELDARDGRISDDEHPRLIASETAPTTAHEPLWQRLSSGTRITLLGVDLSGYGPQSLVALSSQLANQFLLHSGKGPSVLMSVWQDGTSTPPEFQKVQKRIAFGNLVFVARDVRPSDVVPSEVVQSLESVRIPVPELKAGAVWRPREDMGFSLPALDDPAVARFSEDIDLAARTYKGRPYRLSGWIGAHATINSDDARLNDVRFDKNKYYNPSQIRVYVRGKLASDRLLEQIGITGTYKNYIEGEISFDILDDDSLPDIATSNRQDFDETDGRIALLRALVRPVVRALIQRRNKLASDLGRQARDEQERRETAGKTQFSRQLRADLDQFPEIPAERRDEFATVITNKIQGEVKAKTEFRVFISHASEDYRLARLIDEFLASRGALKDEVFFTSRSGNIEPAMDDRALSQVIKENLVSKNTLIFYLTSAYFLDSQYCLFEGGAGWATRSVVEYLKLNVDYGSIPTFLTNGKQEVILRNKAGIELRPDVYTFLVRGILNPMIDHLNRGREIDALELLERLPESDIPSDFALLQEGKVAADYYDTSLVEHWTTLVEPEVQTYLAEYDAKFKS